MSTLTTFDIAVFEGDGIGPEVMKPCCDLLQLACKRISNAGTNRNLELAMHYLPAGAKAYQTLGEALPDASVESARNAHAILLAAMGDPAVRYPDGTELIPQIDLRFKLGLYAGLRPIRSIEGVASPLADSRAKSIDFVLVRESIEGLFAPQGESKIIGDEQAEETLVITRKVSEKLFDLTFSLAQKRQTERSQQQADQRQTRITCVDKANVFPAFAFFRKLFHEAALRHAQINHDSLSAATIDHAYVDIMSLNLVTKPWDYDVMVTENMFGDILSDLGAALIGGMGYAPSADIGDDNAVFQPCHGTAPDIAGQGLANPTAMILSGAMMLDWLSDRHACPEAGMASKLIVRSVDAAFATGKLKTIELGGNSNLSDVATAIKEHMLTLAL